MGNTSTPQSIHALPIPATGGTPARLGFNVQDHVAASYCIRMLFDPELQEIWCEAHDDITLIWNRAAGQEVEFVQVKKEELNQLWSLSKLCQPDSESKTKVGTSILERSLAQHRCAEPCWFRIVTSRDVMEELRGLTYAVDSHERSQCKQKLDALADSAAKKVNGFTSPNGEGCSFWVHRASWEVIHTADAVEARNRIKVAEELERTGPLLMSDQIAELYRKLVKLVFDAGLSTTSAGKKLTREKVLNWIYTTANALAHPATVSGTRMSEKMKAASLPAETIEAARDSRWRYRQRVLNPQYASPPDHRGVEGEVVANLNMLLARLDTGDYGDDGPQFHKRCLQKLEDIYMSDPTAKQLGLAFLQGCMYNVTDRCGHRFIRVSA
jgi:predicted transcriptional regulator